MLTNKKIIWLGSILLTAVILIGGCGKGTSGQEKTIPGNTVSTDISSSKDSSSPAEDNPTPESAVSAYGFPAQMPAFTAKDLDGNELTESIFSEKDLTVLNIWGTFCPPCIGEMPELGEWAKEMPDNVQLIGLITDISGDDDTQHHDLAVEILDKADADFLQIVANQDFAPIMQCVIGVPTTLFIDKEGNLAGDPIIGANVDGYKQFVEEYLNGL
ncbi:MAG: TlpA family protein disulfide reductase [Roseburia sp.]|nr:TlpA family protein disulfide reductase [Roseburia sp.]MCM1241495.1 TlpA family protein disulfide reductase [Roseburia sp.]